jgi:hypothetical protein
MRTRFIARLLSADDTLLAWAEVWAEPRPQEGRASCPLFAVPSATRFTIEADGTVDKLAVHWPDLDVARVRALTGTPVKALQVFDFLWIEPVWLVAGMANVVLPAVTVRAPIVAAPPTGSLVQKDSRT